MVYAFSGSHRSGKTTLAKAVAEDLGIEFYETRTGDVLKQAGINIVGDMSIKDRMVAQELLLDHHLKMLAELPRPLIVDRCPIDMLAYTLGEISMHAVKDDPELDARISAYAARCLKSMELHYAVGLICSPLPAYDAQDGKPPPSRAYQSHIHHLITGAFTDLEHVTRVDLITQDFEQRREYASDAITDAMKDMADTMGQYWAQ